MTGSTKTESSPRGIWIALAVVAVVAIVAALAFVLMQSPEQEPTTGDATNGEPTAPTELAESGETIFGAVGTPIEIDPFVLTVEGGGRADLETLGVGAPPEGTFYYVVDVLFENRGETIPLNALPYSVDGATLEADGEPVEGVLNVPFGSPITEGTVPSGVRIPLSFVFGAPDGSSEFVFVWEPVESGLPKIVVDTTDR